MDVSVDIDALRRKHKTELVERALRIYLPSNKNQTTKAYWLERLLEGEDLGRMLECLRQGQPIPHEAANTPAPCISSGSIEVIDRDLEFHADGRRKLWVQIKNHSSSAWETTPSQPLYAAYHWYDEHGNVHHFDGKRTSLPKTIEPGESAAIEIDVVNPTAPGVYQFMATMVLEGRFWLEERQLAAGRISIEVLEYDGDGLTRHARDIYQRLKRAAMEAEV